MSQQGNAEGYPAGADLIEAGKCPKGEVNVLLCWFCMEGHATECHYPETCEEAHCSHLSPSERFDEYPD